TGRRIAGGRGTRGTPQAGRARPADSADARRPALALARDQLRRAMAALAQSRINYAGPALVPGLRRQPAAGDAPRDGTTVRGSGARRPQRARSVEVRSHMVERTTC